MTQSKINYSINELTKQNIKYILCDIDDTLTLEGKLISEAYDSLWRLSNAGFKVVPITGRPAGWCEMIARFWPVDGVVGENGAFYFYYDKNKMHRKYSQSETVRKENSKKLLQIQNEILTQVPGSAVASDQFCRSVDLAIDFCEDVPALSESGIKKIVQIFKNHGAEAKVSSIHVNGWFGKHDKLTTTLDFLKDRFQMTDTKKIKDEVIFIGDSPNDEPMFEFFPQSVGVKNIEKFLSQLTYKPKYICNLEGGYGFSEMSAKLLT